MFKKKYVSLAFTNIGRLLLGIFSYNIQFNVNRNWNKYAITTDEQIVLECYYR